MPALKHPFKEFANREQILNLVIGIFRAKIRGVCLYYIHTDNGKSA